MYVVILLKDGRKETCGRYDSVRDFRYDYPDVEFITVGRIIYINDTAA